MEAVHLFGIRGDIPRGAVAIHCLGCGKAVSLSCTAENATAWADSPRRCTIADRHDKFEFKIDIKNIESESAVATSAEAWEAEMNLMGAQGWQMVSSAGQSSGSTIYTCTIWMRRLPDGQ